VTSIPPILAVEFPEDFLPPEGGLTISACADENYPQPKPRRPPTRSLGWRGDVAEALFEWRAMSLNLVCATPCSDGVPFDRVVITRRGRYLIQIKQTNADGTGRGCRGWLLCLVRSCKGLYRRGDFDFLAALIPDGTWFIIPFAAIEGYTNITLPHGDRSQKHNRFAQYREAWHLFE
jgi:hypothetical protein